MLDKPRFGAVTMSFRAFVAGILGLSKTDESSSTEKDLLAAVEHVAGKVDPKVRWASNYRQRLKPAVRRTLAYADELVEKIPGPYPIHPDAWDKDPLVHSLFTSPRQVERRFYADPEIQNFFQHSGTDAGYAVLTMTKQEKTVFGTESWGELVRRDVPQISVEFTDHRVLLSASDEAEFRRELTEELLTYLAGQALEEILALKSWHQELVQEREILDMQLKIRKSGNRGIRLLQNEDEVMQMLAAENVLADLHQKIREVRRQLDEPGDYVEHVEKVLLHPETYLSVDRETLRLNEMGMKIKTESSVPVNEFTLGQVNLKNGHRRWAALVRCFRTDA
jgi:hypothetical protein